MSIAPLAAVPSARGPAAVFRGRIGRDARSGHYAAPHRYRLHLSTACPDGLRLAVGHSLLGLDGDCPVTLLPAIPDCPGGGHAALRPLYEASAHHYTGPALAPVLSDDWSGRIVSTRAPDILRDLDLFRHDGRARLYPSGRSPPSTTSAPDARAYASGSPPAPTRPRTSAAGPPPPDRLLRRPRRAGTAHRAVRRGRRPRGSRTPALGQLGGRRRDPGRGDRPLHRPAQAALHRLPGPLLQRQGPLRHPPAAARPAPGHRPRPPVRRVPARGPPGRRRLCHPARRGRGPRDRSAPSRRRRAAPTRPCTSSATSSSSSTTAGPLRRPAATGSTRSPASRTPVTPRSSRGRPPNSPTCWRDWRPAA